MPALVLVAVLGFVAAGVEYGSPTINKAALTAAVDANVGTPATTPAPSSEKVDLKAETVTCNGAQVTVGYACTQKGKTSELKTLQQTCQPGFSYEIREKDGEATITPKADRPTSCGRVAKCPDRSEARRGIVEIGQKCEVKYCPPEGIKGDCKKVGDVNPGENLGVADKRATGLASLIKDSTPEDAQKIMQQVPAADRPGLRDAFAAEGAKIEDARTAKAADVASAQQRLEQIIKNCEFDGAVCTPEANPSVKEAQDGLDAENKRLKELEQQKDRLAAAQVALQPGRPDPNKPYYLEQTDESGRKLWCDQNGNCKPADQFTPPPGQGGSSSGAGGCQDGKCTAGDIVPKDFHCIRSVQPVIVHPVKAGSVFPTGCYNDRNAPPISTFPSGPRNTTGFGGGSGAGSLGSLLSGLAKALGGAMGAPQPPKQPPQTCSTDPNIYAQQQQQYQQAQQQYNYQLQQYNYQQQMQRYNSSYYGSQNYTSLPPQPVQPQPCNPSTGQQCTAQPAQPPASSCSVGYWKPTYNGVCITNWQCTSVEQLKAEISCQPKVADAGMTLAISYACSSGTATSSAFQVTTQPSGSATTTVASPPAGTNAATYGITCVDGGKTAGAQCSIQVSKAFIILVGNPKTVKANGTSLLGWITTGMKSCVVSSPDQADFTARNFFNTSPSGTATTSPISSQATFLLHCETLAGGTKDATTTISIAQ